MGSFFAWLAYWCGWKPPEAVTAERQVAAMLITLQDRRAEIDEVDAEWNSKVRAYKEALESSTTTLRQTLTALDEERAKNRVNETTINVLTAANDGHLKRYDAEVAIQSRRAVANTV